MAFLGSFIQYIITFLILVAMAALGLFVGKILRNRKDAKDAAASASSNAKE